MKKYVKIFKGVKIPWILILVMFGVVVAESTVAVKTVRLSADIIDSAQKSIEFEPLLRYLGYTAATVAISVATVWIGEITYGLIKKRVRNKLYGHILRLPASYYDSVDGGELVSRITVDCDSSSYYFEVLITSVGCVYQAILSFAALFEYNARMGAYCLLIIPLTCAIAGIYGAMSFAIARMGVNSNAETTGYLFERISAFRMIKAYRTTHREMADANKMFAKMFRAETLSEMTIAFIQLGMQLINITVIVITFVFGSMMIKNGQLTMGELIAFFSLSGLVGIQLINLFLNFGTFTAVNGSMKNVALILEEKPERTDGRELPGKNADIVFEDVSFGYGDIEVLHHINLMIPADSITAIIGTNGAGKSTVFKLLSGMYEPTSGKILYGDEASSEYSLKSWRDHFAVVSQSAPLTSGTIRENLCYGAKREMSDEELMEVADKCGVGDYIRSQENGLDSDISVGSTNLSGGQRQALAIARAMVKDSPYLLLDEATKSLDAENERMVENAIAGITKGRTTVMIAHNPSAIVHADYIIIMKDGRVDACGSREALLKTNEYFRKFTGETNEI